MLVLRQRNDETRGQGVWRRKRRKRRRAWLQIAGIIEKEGRKERRTKVCELSMVLLGAPARACKEAARFCGEERVIEMHNLWCDQWGEGKCMDMFVVCWLAASADVTFACIRFDNRMLTRTPHVHVQ